MAVPMLHSFHRVDDEVDEAEHARALGGVMLEWPTGDAVGGNLGAPMFRGMATDRIDYRCALVVVDEEGARVRELPVTFSERVIAGQRSLMIGGDLSGSFRVRLEAALPPTEVQLHFQYRPVSSATPADLLPIVELLDALDGSRRLGLWSLATERWAADPMPLAAEIPRLPDGYRSTIALLARVHRLAGQTFPMPEQITHEDAHNIRQAERLLSGSTITGRWQHASLTVDREGFEFIRNASEAHGALLEFATDYAVDIAGRTLALGRAEHRLLQALVAPETIQSPAPLDNGDVTVELIPGTDDRFEISLIPAATEPTGGNAAGTGLETYAGRWIAQGGGGEVIEVGDTPTEVLAALRSSGRTAAIWRVPRSRKEAEAILTGAM